MKLPLVALTNPQLDAIMEVLVQDQPMTIETLQDLAQVQCEMERRAVALLLAADASLYSEASDIDRYLPLAGRA